MCKNIAKSTTATEAKPTISLKLQILMGEFLVDGPEAELRPAVVQVDRKDTNLTPFKTLFQDPHI